MYEFALQLVQVHLESISQIEIAEGLVIVQDVESTVCVPCVGTMMSVAELSEAPTPIRGSRVNTARD